MSFLLALMLTQLGEAPHIVRHLQDGLDGAELVEDIVKLNRHVDDARVGTSGGIDIHRVITYTLVTRGWKGLR